MVNIVTCKYRSSIEYSLLKTNFNDKSDTFVKHFAQEYD